MRLIDADALKTTRSVAVDNTEGKVQLFTERLYRQETIDNAPTVEAIPIEWLKKKAQEFAKRYWNKKDDHKKLMLPMSDCPIVIEQMIKEWRVENATD